MNLSSFASTQVQAAEASQIEVSQEIPVYRVYYDFPEEIQQLMAFDLFEFNNLEEKYVLVAVTADEVKKIDEMGFKVALDETETANFSLLATLSQNQLNTIPGYSCYRTVERLMRQLPILLIRILIWQPGPMWVIPGKGALVSPMDMIFSYSS